MQAQPDTLLNCAALSFLTSRHGEPMSRARLRHAARVSHETDATCDSVRSQQARRAARGALHSHRGRSGSQVQGRRPLRWNRSEPRDWWGSDTAIGLLRRHAIIMALGHRASHLQDVRMDVPLRDRGRGSSHRTRDFVHPTLVSRPNT
jgi:hypothetical protein